MAGTPPWRAIAKILTAFQQMEDNLAALRILSQEAQQQKEATTSAQESLQTFTDGCIGGADPYLQVLTAQTIALQNERNDVDILRRRTDASVLLVTALGGGGLYPNCRKRRNCGNRNGNSLEIYKGARYGS
jgi:outer membrane protein TolC